MNDRAKWLQEAKWGVFFHYLPHMASSCETPDMTVEKWNDRVNAFRTEALAEQLAECGVRYFFITIGQCSGYYLAPNSVYDEIVGRKSSRCAERDLIADLADALAKHDIRLLVYLPFLGPGADKTAANEFDYKYKRNCPDVTAETLRAFHIKWERVIRQWSEQWGPKVHGWWMDCCYNPEWFSGHAPNFTSFAKAMRAGNPDSILSFASGKCSYPDVVSEEEEDYTSGEFNGLLPLGFLKRSISDTIGSKQGHLLSFLGDYWGVGSPRFSDDFAKHFTREVNSRDFAISWDVPPLVDGTISPAFCKQLKALD